ncbi:MAG: LptF/LptG family permease [Hyphomicrobiales bacterium]|nr:LptF/LptG family permease [Hyphomicrobiales bacterium]MCY4049375.1 LptF/LptG family permease [Hyphomicrobiales bacterium]MCY4052386.1 LptF/LptG family permease [Hyphomicrobiales bacterium]
MSRQFRYIFLQMFAPFLTACVILMVLLYLVNIPRVLDVLLAQGGAVNLMFLMLVFITPKILAYILPVALLVASLYVLYRLHIDLERVAMQASGFTYWSIARPMLAFAAGVLFVVLVIHAYIMPLGQRAFQDRVFEINETITAAVLRPGQFNTLTSGVTAFVRSRDSNGVIRDILVQDARDPERPTSYLAAQGTLLQAPEGLRLEMRNGSIHRFEEPDNPASLNILRFDRYLYDLSELTQKSETRILKSRERFLYQLFYPDMSEIYNRSRVDTFRADAHNRLASPLFCLAYVLIALAAFRELTARYGYLPQIIVTISVALTARLVYLGITGLTTENPIWNLFLYVVPLGVSLFAVLFIIYGVHGIMRFVPRTREAGRGAS